MDRLIMPLQDIINGESGLDVRTALMDMFTELYGAIFIPIKMAGTNGNVQAQIPANSIVLFAAIQPVSGAPVVSVGLTGGGGEVLPQQAINQTQPIGGPIPYDAATTWYFTVAGGVVNISILAISSIYQ